MCSFSIDYILLGCCIMWSIKIVALMKCGYCFPSLPTCHWGCILVRHIIIGSFAQLWSPWLCSRMNRCKWLLILKLLHTCNVSPKFASLIYSLLCTLCSAGRVVLSCPFVEPFPSIVHSLQRALQGVPLLISSVLQAVHYSVGRNLIEGWLLQR